MEIFNAKVLVRTSTGFFLAVMFFSVAMGQGKPLQKGDGCGEVLRVDRTTNTPDDAPSIDTGPTSGSSIEKPSIREAVLSESLNRSSLEGPVVEIANRKTVQRSGSLYRPGRASSLAEDDNQTTRDAPASNGSSPVDLITRIEMKYQFQNFASGYMHGVPVIRVDYAFSKALGVRIDLPILHFDSKIRGQQNETGIGDIVTSMTFVKMVSKRFIFGVVPRFDFPTATASALGSGKYSFKPTVAGLTPVAKGLAFGTALEYRISFAGDRNRADLHELSIKPLFLKSFLSGPLKGFYANPQLEVIVDFETNNRTTWQGAVHMGKVLTKNVVVFWIPTFHVAGTKRESFKFEAGFRYLFR